MTKREMKREIASAFFWWLAMTVAFIIGFGAMRVGDAGVSAFAFFIAGLVSGLGVRS